MLRYNIIFVLVVLGALTSSSLIFPIKSSSENNYKRNPLITIGDADSQKNLFETIDYRNVETKRTPGKRRSREYFENDNYQNSQSHNVFGLNGNKNTFDLRNEKPDSQNAQYINSFGGYGRKSSQNPLTTINYGQNLKTQDSFGNQNTFLSDCNVTSNTIAIRKPGRNNFKAPNYLPPIDTKKSSSKGTKPPNTVIRHLKSYDIPMETHGTTKRPYCHTCASTKGPFYKDKPPTSTYHSIQTNNHDAKMNEYDPAMAMEVPFEEDEMVMVTPVTKTEKPSNTTTGITRQVNVELKQTTPKITIASTMKISRPVDHVSNGRGDVPDEYDDLATTTTKSDNDALARAKPVPRKPEDEIPTKARIPTTVAVMTSPLNTSALSTTTNGIQKMTTTENNRHLIEKESSRTTPFDNILTTTPTNFIGPEYLPPKDSTTKRVLAITTTPNTHTNAPAVAPAMAMNVPTEPEDVPNLTPPSPSTNPLTTTSTSPITTKMTTLENNRHLIEEESSPATPLNKMHTTTSIAYKGREYLPPKDSTTRIPTVKTTSSAVAPAMAMDVPPEPKDVPISTSSPSPLPAPTTITLTDTFRAAATSSTNIPFVPGTNSFKAPGYLPPKEVEPSPLPAVAMEVPPEPECDPDPTYPKIDPRSFIDDPCAPNTSKPSTVPPFKGPSYLPSLPKTRVERSSNKTLSLSDLEGTPHPMWYAGVYRKTTEPPYPMWRFHRP